MSNNCYEIRSFRWFRIVLPIWVVKTITLNHAKFLFPAYFVSQRKRPVKSAFWKCNPLQFMGPTFAILVQHLSYQIQIITVCKVIVFRQNIYYNVEVFILVLYGIPGLLLNTIRRDKLGYLVIHFSLLQMPVNRHCLIRKIGNRLTIFLINILVYCLYLEYHLHCINGLLPMWSVRSDQGVVSVKVLMTPPW